MFLKSMLPYTRKAWAALAGTLIAITVVVLQDDALLGWVGSLPSPWNELLVAVLGFLTMWLVREQGRRTGEGVS